MRTPTILGAIVGDTIGSVYEFDPTKDYNFPLHDDMEYTDDSVLTIAIADWILNNPEHDSVSLSAALRTFARRYPNPMGSYGTGFLTWFHSSTAEPYNSWGNGAAMRVSAVGFAFDTLEETLRVAETSASVSHNHPEGVKGAQATAAAIFLARTGATKEEIRKYVETTFNYDLKRSYEDIKKVYHFDASCQGTVPESIIAFLESSSYEDAIRKTIALGGDADTMGAITGAIAAAYYKEIPAALVDFTIERLPDDLREVVERFEEKYGATTV